MDIQNENKAIVEANERLNKIIREKKEALERKRNRYYDKMLRLFYKKFPEHKLIVDEIDSSGCKTMKIWEVTVKKKKEQISYEIRVVGNKRPCGCPAWDYYSEIYRILNGKYEILFVQICNSGPCGSHIWNDIQKIINPNIKKLI